MGTLVAAPAVAPRNAPEAKVSRTLLNFWLDAALLLAMAFVLWVSAVLQVVFPAPTTAAGWQLWGLSFDQWRDLQFYALCGAALLALEHLVLHWSWVCNVIATKILRTKARPDEGVQAIYGVATFTLLLTLTLGSILVATLMVQRPVR